MCMTFPINPQYTYFLVPAIYSICSNFSLDGGIFETKPLHQCCSKPQNHHNNDLIAIHTNIIQRSGKSNSNSYKHNSKFKSR